MSVAAQVIAAKGDDLTSKPTLDETIPPDGTVRKNAERAVAEIARRVLRLETLDTRNSDALDFHELAVWSICDALLAAYHAGVSAATATKED